MAVQQNGIAQDAAAVALEIGARGFPLGGLLPYDWLWLAEILVGVGCLAFVVLGVRPVTTRTR